MRFHPNFLFDEDDDESPLLVLLFLLAGGGGETDDDSSFLENSTDDSKSMPCGSSLEEMGEILVDDMDEGTRE